MGATPLTEVPTRVYAGTTLDLDLSLPSYPADDGWTLTLYYAGKSVGNKAGTANGSRFSVVLDETETALLAGNYVWRLVVVKSPTTAIAASGVFEVVADISTAAAGDLQTFEEKMLAVIEAALEGRLTSDMEAFSIAGRSVTKIPIKELVELREVYKRAVDAQRNPGRFRPQMRVTFTGANGE